MAVYRLWKGEINGGGSDAMDSIDPTDIDGSATALTVGSVCVVVDKANGIYAEYEAKSTASMTESYPDIIIPDTNPSNWWWDLITIRFDYEDAVNLMLGYANTPGAF